MKNIIRIAILLLSFQLKAQIITPMEQMVNFTRTGTYENHYFKDVNNELNKFLGNWKYQTANDLVEISIYKDLRVGRSMGYYCDGIHIKFKYVKNGTTLFDTFITNENYLISGGYFRFPTDTNKYHILYREPSQNRFSIHQSVDLEYIPTSGQPQLNWVAVYECTDSLNPSPPQMPLNMVFIKQP